MVIAGLFGVVVLAQFRSEQTDVIDDGLRARFQDVQQALAVAPKNDITAEINPALPRGEGFAQVLGTEGDVLAASPRSLDDAAVVDRSAISSARAGEATLVRKVPANGDRARLLVGPARVGSRDVVLVIGTKLAETEQAFDRLALALVIGLPLLAGLVSLGGWFLAGAALAPVRSMIEEADELSAREPGRRLTVPASGGAEIIELAERLNEMLARIEAAVTHERAFLDDASHELRTPLAIMRGEVELARMSVADGSDQAETLDSVMEEILRLQRLTADLLVLARTRASAAPERPMVELAEIVVHAAQSVLRLRTEPGPEILIEGDAVVRGDRDALERACGNLLENACRYAADAVRVSVAAADGSARIEVRDDGPGFPPDLLGPRAFERFAHADAPGARGGAGLGLAIVGAIAAAHGGSVTAENADPAGAIVRLTLPAPSS